MEFSRFKKLDVIGIFFLFFSLFFLIIIFVSDQDIRAHAVYATEMLTGKRPTAGNFLFYWLVNLFSFFSPKKIPSLVSISLLIAFAESFRYYLSKKLIYSTVAQTEGISKKYLFSALVALSLLFVYAIPLPGYFIDRPGYSVTHFFYIGSFAPNVWHNSTILFVFPVAILLFYVAYKQLKDFDKNRNYWILLLILLNIFIKPSYFFVFASTYPIFLLINYKLEKKFWLAIMPVVIGSFCLLLEYFLIYSLSQTNSKEVSGVIFKPFWTSTLAANLWQLPVAIFFSLLFPFAYFVLNAKKLFKIQLFWLVLLTQFVSITIYLFIAETGPRAGDQNFYWQIVIGTWLCYASALVSLIKDYSIEGLTSKNKTLFVLYSLHVLIGVIYFVRLFVVDTYS